MDERIGVRHHGLLIIWWDEGDLSGYSGTCASGSTDDRANGSGSCSGGGRVAVVIAAAGGKSGYHSQTYAQHTAITKLIAQALGITVPAAASGGSCLADFF